MESKPPCPGNNLLGIKEKLPEVVDPPGVASHQFSAIWCAVVAASLRVLSLAHRLCSSLWFCDSDAVIQEKFTVLKSNVMRVQAVQRSQQCLQCLEPFLRS